MKSTTKWNPVLLALISIALILAGGLYYIYSVQDSLWEKSVTDILEVTTQGRHALDTYIEKDREMLHSLAGELSSLDSDDRQAIQNRMKRTGESDSSYLCVNLTDDTFYTCLTDEGRSLDPEYAEQLRALEGAGVREPFLEDRTGLWAIGYYEYFSFADGAEGFLQKTQLLSEIAERFSLSFYNNTGFSYVVNRQGEILIRSPHRNSNRTFKNLFDIIGLQGNDPEEFRSFRTSLSNGQRGATLFQYQGEDYVFCYVPMENVPGWYVVSIVPDRVIMEQADNIVRHSQLFFFLIIGSIVVMAAFFIVYRNSTRQILRAEEEARKAAESANMAKSRFMSKMYHDIRTPKNANIGMAKLASDHLREPERVREYLKNISLSGQLLIGLINDILDMSKIESGRMSLNSDTSSLEEVMTNLVRIVQPSVNAKNLNFDIRLHNIQHEVLCFDKLRLNQILLNLLSNAVKFTPAGGSITMDVTETPSKKENRTHLSFRISDTGIGMKPDFLEHIFESFTREQDSQAGRIEGTGLGMAITKMIVDMMEGTIDVKSAPGDGSTFLVELDFLLDGEIPREMPALPALHILVADDEPAACSSAKEFLCELGADADITVSGTEAVKLAYSAHEDGRDYSMILMDWRMPDLSGLEAARAIRQQLGDDTPLIIVSAYDWASIEADAMKAGVNGFIQKPLFKSTLYRCIRRNILHEEAAAESIADTTGLNDRRILLAEDNEFNREIAQEILEDLGAELDTAHDGLACVTRFKDSPVGYYDLILMDIQMPIMNGYEATRRIRSLERPDALKIPIFAMTADAFAEDIEAAREAGMNSHLAKPLDIPGMIREIRKWLG